MALAARERGYEYLAITDHSASHGFGNDVSPAALARQIERIAEVNSRIDGLRLLAGSEVSHPASTAPSTTRMSCLRGSTG